MFENVYAIYVLYDFQMLSSSCKDYGVELYGGPEVDLNNIKEWLKKFEGGNVIFKRDDTVGIAEIIFDHPTKKNAISGGS